MQVDELYMQQALELAEQGRGKTSPNPMVGAVVVKNDEVIGNGYHHQAGTPHAEVHALQIAGKAAKDATLYVTLEPCCHYGLTPPCSQAIIAAGISRVVVAIRDPNPKVAGQGIAKLQRAGIEVEVGILEAEAKKQNEVFLKYIQTQLPFVLLKAAMTLDGKIASCTGNSQWITNEKSRTYVHQLRREYDAILVGIGTVLKDDPQLDVRLLEEKGRNPLRIVLDPDLKLPCTSKIAQTAEKQPTIIFCSEKIESLDRIRELEKMQVEIIPLGENSEQIPLRQMLVILGQRNITSLLVEGGGEIHASFLAERLADKICWFISPKIIGGKNSPSPVGGSGIPQMSDAIKLQDITTKWFEDDISIEGKPVYNT